MNATAPRVKIEMIESSLRCFVLGLFSLLPVVGIPLLLLTFQQSRRVNEICRNQWNPAHRCLWWGMVCARLGVALTALEGVAAMAVYIQKTR
jgi:hypothetical protein